MNNSISQSLREYYQLEAHSVDDKIEAVRATQEDVQILRCSYNSPLMLVSGIAYAPSGELGFGVWGLGIGPNPQSPIPNPQSPIPNPQLIKIYQNFKNI